MWASGVLLFKLRSRRECWTSEMSDVGADGRDAEHPWGQAMGRDDAYFMYRQGILFRLYPMNLFPVDMVGECVA